MPLTPQAIQALEYVFNTGGNATIQNFFEDHEPIGDALWQEIRRDRRLVTLNEHCKLVLTDDGRAVLSAAVS